MADRGTPQRLKVVASRLSFRFEARCHQCRAFRFYRQVNYTTGVRISIVICLAIIPNRKHIRKVHTKRNFPNLDKRLSVNREIPLWNLDVGTDNHELRISLAVGPRQHCAGWWQIWELGGEHNLGSCGTVNDGYQP